ncbi:MAG: cytochrome c biogenesis CcdA family protein [Thermoplasmata archaeon]
MQMDRKKAAYAIGLAILIIITAFLVMDNPGGSTGGDIEPATDFTVTDHLNREVNLSSQSGKVVVLHITQLEVPLCIECEDSIVAQLREMETLAGMNDPNITVITLNIRKNAYSADGWELANEWYGVNATWHWAEEFEPFSAAGPYQKYWESDNALANPTIILINPGQEVVGAYRVYLVGSGAVDGVQTSESLRSDAAEIMAGEWDDDFRGDVSAGITFGGLFVLGIVTSLAPCSIALLLTAISYIGSMRQQEEKSDDWEKGLWIGISFSAGMTLIFFLIGLLISYVGIFIEMSATFYLLAGIILIILGINVFKPLGEILAMLKGQGGGASCKTAGGNGFIQKLSKRSGYLAAFVLGIVFSVGWAPCALSMMFPVIVLMLTQDVSLLMGGLMMAVFGFGHGMIIIPFCMATGEMKGRIGNRFVSAGKWIQPMFGIIVVAMGVILAARYWGFNLW